MIIEIKQFLQNNPELTERDVNYMLRPLIDAFRMIMNRNRASFMMGTPLGRLDLKNESELIKKTLNISLTNAETYDFILRYVRSLIK